MAGQRWLWRQGGLRVTDSICLLLLIVVVSVRSYSILTSVGLCAGVCLDRERCQRDGEEGSFDNGAGMPFI